MLHKKAASTEFEKLQKRVEELENRMKKVQDNSQGGRSWGRYNRLSREENSTRGN